MMYLLDTNIISYLLKGVDNVKQKIQSIDPDSISTSVITVLEIESGLLYPNVKTDTKLKWFELKESIHILDFDYDDAIVASHIRAKLKATGTSIGAYDLLIGSQAIARNLTIVTNNIKEFHRINNLKIENWYLEK